MIWWPFNKKGETIHTVWLVVTHQWSGDPSIAEENKEIAAQQKS